MNIIEKILLKLPDSFYIKYYNFRKNSEVKKYKKKYPDYEDNEFNCGSMKHIWGIKSWDDLSGSDCNFYTMNDIDITYDRDTKEYMLGIETAYCFENKEAECKYLKRLLDAFTTFMDDNGYSKNKEFFLFFSQPILQDKAESIEDLYINFKIFVEGYCSVYTYTEHK